jgi:phosphoribosylaminoimidazolecarboxamide formyltransferase/IMP cyclohydrolase
MKKKIALISVSDKDGITEFARELIELGYTIISSGRTAAHLSDAAIPVTDVANIIGMEAILGHRVVTLHPKIHGGLLALDTPAHLAEMEKYDIQWIDLVCCDFYPLEKVIAQTDSTPEKVLEATDIGGPTQVRSGAKGRRIVICDAKDRALVISWLKEGMPNREEFITKLAAKAEYVVSRYCGISAMYTGGDKYCAVHGQRARVLKYGENPHQKKAILYAVDETDPLALHAFTIAYGGPSGYVTETDVDRGLETIVRACAAMEVNSIPPLKMMVAVKHGNACGASIGSYEEDVIRGAISGDSEAVLGAVVVCNFALTVPLLELIFRAHTPEEKKWGMIAAIACKSISDGAIEVLNKRNSNCIVYCNPSLDYMELGVRHLRTEKIIRQVRGGCIVQDAPVFLPNWKDKSFTLHSGDPSRYAVKDMILAWAVNATSNSNTITIVREGKLLGNAVGQQKRVASSKLAVTKAQFSLSFGSQYPLKGGGRNAIAWSDSFFPYPDGIEVLFNAGVYAVFATHGSKRDQEVIDFCKEKGMLFATWPDNVARAFYGH